MGGIYKVAVKMGSVVMVYIPSFTEIGSGIQKLIRDTQAHRQHVIITDVPMRSELFPSNMSF
jgi:hypothetical protein